MTPPQLPKYTVSANRNTIVDNPLGYTLVLHHFDGFIIYTDSKGNSVDLECQFNGVNHACIHANGCDRTCGMN